MAHYGAAQYRYYSPKVPFHGSSEGGFLLTARVRPTLNVNPLLALVPMLYSNLPLAPAERGAAALLSHGSNKICLQPMRDFDALLEKASSARRAGNQTTLEECLGRAKALVAGDRSQPAKQASFAIARFFLEANQSR